jgi:hypothetical protein
MDIGRRRSETKAACASDGRRLAHDARLNHDGSGGYRRAVWRKHVSAHAEFLLFALLLRTYRNGHKKEGVDQQHHVQDWHGVRCSVQPPAVSRQPPSAHVKCQRRDYLRLRAERYNREGNAMTPDKTRHEHTPEEERRIREAALDQTIEGSFPASDPPSTDPNPDNHDAVVREPARDDKKRPA